MKKMSQIKDEIIQDIICLYNSGLAIINISKKLRVAPSTINKYLKLNNIEIHKPSFYRKGKRLSDNHIKSLKDKWHDNPNRKCYSAGLNKKPVELNVYNEYLSKAKKKNLEFSLTLEIFKRYIFQNCYYCNEKPSRICRHHIEIPINGIDRLNSELGYIIDNCVTCCTMCNRMKNIYSKVDFLNQIEKIYGNRLVK